MTLVTKHQPESQAHMVILSALGSFCRIMSTSTQSPVCPFFKFGHCKFNSKCRLLHISEICSSPSCDPSLCSLRHPKPCHLFNSGFCKFCSSCSFLHTPPHPPPQDPKLQLLIDEVTRLSARVLELEKLVTAPPPSTVHTPLIPSPSQSAPSTPAISFSCDHCEHTLTTKEGIIRHMARKHQPEILRSPSPPVSPLLSPPSSECDPNTSTHTPAYPHHPMSTCPHCDWPVPFDDHITNLHQFICHGQSDPSVHSLFPMWSLPPDQPQPAHPHLMTTQMLYSHITILFVHFMCLLHVNDHMWSFGV